MNADHIRHTRPNVNPLSRAVDKASQPSGAIGRTVSERDAGRLDEALHAAAPEIIELTARLGELPTSRVEVIQPVRERVAAGYYLTRSSAVKTAAAIVAS